MINVGGYRWENSLVRPHMYICQELHIVFHQMLSQTALQWHIWQDTSFLSTATSLCRTYCDEKLVLTRVGDLSLFSVQCTTSYLIQAKISSDETLNRPRSTPRHPLHKHLIPSAHLPCLTLGTAFVSCQVALASKHAGAAGHSHTVVAVCVIIEHLTWKYKLNVHKITHNTWDTVPESWGAKSGSAHPLGRHRCWWSPGWRVWDWGWSNWEQRPHPVPHKQGLPDMLVSLQSPAGDKHKIDPSIDTTLI